MARLVDTEVEISADGKVHVVHCGEFHLHVHYGSVEYTAKLDEIIANQAKSEERDTKMAGELDALQTEVTNNTAVDQSAITLLNGLSAQIASLKNDPAKLQALADSLKKSSGDLAAAVTANTPAAPANGGTTTPPTGGTTPGTATEAPA